MHFLGLHLFWNFSMRVATFIHHCCNSIMPVCYHMTYKTCELLSIILRMINFGKRNTFILVIHIKHWAHWCNSNVIHLYFGGAQFEFLPGHFLWLRFFTDFPRPSRQAWGQSLFFHVSFHLSSISSRTVGYCIVGMARFPIDIRLWKSYNLYTWWTQ